MDWKLVLSKELKVHYCNEAIIETIHAGHNNQKETSRSIKTVQTRNILL